MQIAVSGTFQFSQVFGGKLGVTTDCTLAIESNYYLIYAELRNFDVLQTLNQAFDLGLGSASLIVVNAGFFTFSTTTSAPPQATLSSVFPNSPVPAAVATAATPVTNTTSFWLTVDLGGSNSDQGLFGSLVDLGISSGTQLSLSATFASNTPAGTAIKTAVYTLALSGSISLFGVFTFHDIVVNYSMGTSTRIAVAGGVDVSVFGSDFTFSGSVLSDSAVQAVTANVAAQGTANLSSLFGGAFPNISFTGLSFNLYYPYGKNQSDAQFMLRGNCDFAGLQFTGLLYMQGTTPALASVVFTQSASISTLFDQCIPGASWPTSLVDLTLFAGAEAYYNGTSGPLTLTLSNDGTGPTLLPVPTPPPPAGNLPVATATVPPAPTVVTFLTGFNLAASFELSLLDTIEIDGTIVVNSNGVTASIAIDSPIDIYVLQITRQGDATHGPLLSISTAGAGGTMGFTGALIFFGENFGVNVTVDATRDDAGNLLVTATLSPTKAYPPVLQASDTLTFSYSNGQGFKIEDWPAFTQAQALIDFFTELKNLADAGGGGCGSIGDFVLNDLLQQSYTMKPSFSSSGSGGLSLSLSISYTLSFAGSQGTTPFATITLPDAFVIPIPNSVTLNDPSSPSYLWNVIANAIGAAAESFVQALLNNPNAIANFLVLFAGRQAVAYAATLICEGLADGVVDAAVEAGVNAAAGALGTAAVGVAGVAAAVAAAVTAGGGGGGGGGGRSDPPKAPGELAVTATSSTITASWQLSSGAQDYAATLSGPSGTIATSGDLSYSANSYTFSNVTPPTPLPAACTVSVIASNNAGASPAATTPLTFLAPPTNLSSRSATAAPPDAAVEIDWTAAAGATGYSVSLIGGKTDTISVEAPTATLSFTPTDPAGAYIVSVSAEGGAATIPSAESQPLALTRLAAPTGLAAAATTTSIDATWTSTDGAASYALAWTAPAGTTGAQAVAAVAGSAQSGSIALPTPVVAGVWSVAVQALPAGGPGLTVAGPPSSPVSVTVPSTQTPAELAAACFTGGVSGADCGTKLIQAFPTLTATPLAVAMAQGGYAAGATGDGLQAAFPLITPTEMAQALAQAYP